MLNHEATDFFIATILGCLSGLGIGGGSLLFLWLTLVAGIEMHEARMINLLFFIITAGTVSYLRFRNQKLTITKLIPAIIAGCISSGAVAAMSRNLDVAILSRIFAWVMIFTGIRELFYRPRNAR